MAFSVEEALYLSNLASKVTVVHRRNRFRAEPILRDRLLARPNLTSFGTTSSKKLSASASRGSR
ncbi:hypothetical protein GOD21_30000 [Sinorhizobium medicae]|nr:hypothetical protein [Sinorhizobium medicae]